MTTSKVLPRTWLKQGRHTCRRILRSPGSSAGMISLGSCSCTFWNLHHRSCFIKQHICHPATAIAAALQDSGPAAPITAGSLLNTAHASIASEPVHDAVSGALSGYLFIWKSCLPHSCNGSSAETIRQIVAPQGSTQIVSVQVEGIYLGSASPTTLQSCAAKCILPIG